MDPRLATRGRPEVDELQCRVRELVDEDRLVEQLLNDAHRLIDADELAAAASLMMGALTAGRPNIAILTQLAWIERLRGQDHAALDHLAAAQALAGVSGLA